MLYFIVGPTGSSKTSISTKLSDMLNDAPIVNGDAFQIYQEMNIGTAKIEEDSPYFKRHYLINIKRPDENYSIMEYQKDFRKMVDELKKNYQDIIICGGSGLYIRSAIYDYKFEEKMNDVDMSDTDNLSNEELYELLKELDVKSSNDIHPNNRKRVLRAIEIARTNSLNKSENESLQKHEYIYPKEEIKIFFINPNREELYENINRRVDKMIQDGLVDEVKYLLNKYHLSQTASQAIGYKEIISYLNDEMDLESVIELIKKRSRNYAKRQITFFKHQFETIEVNKASDILNYFR